MSRPAAEVLAAALCILDANPSPNVLFGAPAVSLRQLEADLAVGAGTLDPSALVPLLDPLCASLFAEPRRPVACDLGNDAWLVFERCKPAAESLRPLRLGDGDERRRARRRTRIDDLRRWSRGGALTDPTDPAHAHAPPPAPTAGSRLSVDWSGSPARARSPVRPPAPPPSASGRTLPRPPARRPRLAVRTDTDALLAAPPLPSSPLPSAAPRVSPVAWPQARPAVPWTADAPPTPTSGRTATSSKARSFLRPLFLGRSEKKAGRVIDLAPVLAPPHVSDSGSGSVLPAGREEGGAIAWPASGGAGGLAAWQSDSETRAAVHDVDQLRGTRERRSDGRELASPVPTPALHTRRPATAAPRPPPSATRSERRLDVDVASSASESFELDAGGGPSDSEHEARERAPRRARRRDAESPREAYIEQTPVNFEDAPSLTPAPTASPNASLRSDTDALDDPPVTWLEQTFDGLPFGPDVPALTMLDGARRQWRLLLAELVLVFGLALAVRQMT